MGATELERLTMAEAAISDLREDVRGIKHDIRELRNDLIGRPSWPMSALLTVLSSSTVGLFVALANNL